MIASRILIGHKINHIINEYADLARIPLREALDVFYKSRLYHEVVGGISDMHCRSDGYLAEELMLEIAENNKNKDDVINRSEYNL